jgi:hypothetical protein
MENNETDRFSPCLCASVVNNCIFFSTQATTKLYFCLSLSIAPFRHEPIIPFHEEVRLNLLHGI